jgi:diguanylate cyclase (GGDEF)-like protein/PAS domain S-box-containing protein
MKSRFQKSSKIESLSIPFDQFGDILSNISEGIIGVNIFGCCSFANPKALEYFNLDSPTEIIGNLILEHLNFSREFTHSSTLEYISELKNKSHINRRGYIKIKDGSIEEVLTWQKPIIIDNRYSGSIIGFELLTSDSPQVKTPINSIERYEHLIESTQVILWEFDLKSEHFTFISPQAESLFGYPIRLWYRKGFWEEKIFPLDKKKTIEFHNRSYLNNESYEQKYRMVKADGDSIYIHDHVSVIKKNGTPITLRGVFSDISNQQTDDNRLKLSSAVFESPDAVVITDSDSHIIQVNNAFTRITGYTKEEVIGKNPSILSSGKQSPSFYKQMWHDIQHNHHWQGEMWNKRKNGDIYVEWLTITPVFDDDSNVCNYVAMFSDISEKKEIEKEIQYKNSHDELTNLINRDMLYRELKDAIISSKKIGRKGALLFLDLDEFKLINDSMGHKYGDKLLIQVADRLKGCISSGDILARIGGDEFSILLPSLGHNIEQSSLAITQIAKNIQDIFKKPFDINNHKLHITSSIGTTIFPTENELASDVLRQADTAMFKAKDAGKNQTTPFTSDMHHRIERHLLIHNELSLAIKRDELSVHFQPQYDKDENITTAEALLRWKHKTHGNITPSEFIPIAEKSGLIISLGNFVIDSVCQYISRWSKDENFPLKRVDINVSCQQFEQDDFYSNLKEALEKHNIPPKLLGLELTEEVMAGDIERIISTFIKVKSLGIHFSIDDFGTGYSSLRYIKRLPIDNLKIDQSFVNDIPYDKSDCIMVNTIIAMARQMDLTVTAEGVETVEQKDFLQNLKCDYYQGYLFNKPLCLKDFEKLINYDQ